MEDQLDINPQTKVGEMLDAYPQLENVLLDISPAFAKLKNPILRRTVARVVSLRQAAETGKIDIGEMIIILRKAVGQDVIDVALEKAQISSDTSYRWKFKEEDVSISFDATEIINGGNSPMKEILAKAHQLEGLQVFELITPFVPQPIIELLIAKGYCCQYDKKEDKIYTYIKKK